MKVGAMVVVRSAALGGVAAVGWTSGLVAGARRDTLLLGSVVKDVVEQRNVVAQHLLLRRSSTTTTTRTTRTTTGATTSGTRTIQMTQTTATVTRKPPQRVAPDVFCKEYVRASGRQPRVDYVVVDVRDADREPGWIPGSINVPAHEFLDDSAAQTIALRIRKMIRNNDEDNNDEDDKDDEDSKGDGDDDPFANVPVVVFHCALSQARGPKCAQRCFSRGWARNSRILILDGGFCRWQQLFHSDSRCVENLDREYWASEYGM